MITYPALRAPSGRYYVRHPSDMGSIMFYSDRGIWKQVLVLDARWRSNQRFGLYEIEIPEFQSVEVETNDQYYIDFLEECSQLATDSWISNFLPWDPMSSKERCDIWMKNKIKEDRHSEDLGYIGCPAVSYCRSILVNGVPCDLPNIQILERIYTDRNTIDRMDKTIEDYSIFALGERNPQGMWTIGKKDSRASSNRFAWSSTEEYYDTVCWGVYYNGNVYTIGKYLEFAVVPVLEL